MTVFLLSDLMKNRLLLSIVEFFCLLTVELFGRLLYLSGLFPDRLRIGPEREFFAFSFVSLKNVFDRGKNGCFLFSKGKLLIYKKVGVLHVSEDYVKAALDLLQEARETDLISSPTLE